MLDYGFYQIIDLKPMYKEHPILISIPPSISPSISLSWLSTGFVYAAFKWEEYETFAVKGKW